MRFLHIIAVFIISVTMLILPLSADIVITKDDMILNGKILEDKKPQHLILANSHGTFTIRYNLIKEIHRTESFEEDVNIFRTLGKLVSEEEVKQNYTAGEKNLEKKFEKNQNKKLNKKFLRDDSDSAILMLCFFADKNFGDLTSVLSYSSGGSLSVEIPFSTTEIYSRRYAYGLDSEVSFYYSADGDRSIKGLNAAMGPLWQIPLRLSDYRFSFNISALAGAGWYSITNDEVGKNETAVKWNISANAGPVFRVAPILVSTQLRLDYIHDRIAPMQGAGLTIGAGYAF